MNSSRLILFACLTASAVAFPGCPSKKKTAPVPDLRGRGEFRMKAAMGSGWNCSAVILGDVNGDGHLDAFQVNYGEQNRLWINDGNGKFYDGTDLQGLLPTGLPARMDFSRCAVFGDVDGDGDLDIIVGNNGQNLLLLNDGKGEFVDATDLTGELPTGLPFGLDDTWALALVNVDGKGGFDSDLDLIVVNQGQNRLYLNDGRGEFLDGTDLAGVLTTGLPIDSDPGRGILVFNADPDLGSDDDMDLLILNEGAPCRLYINSTGFGEYVDATFDTLSRAASLPYISESAHAAAALDMNNDTLTDIVIATSAGNRILLNKGEGLFYDGTSHWTRERVLAGSGLNALAGSSVPYVAVAVGVSGTVRTSSGDGSWVVAASALVQNDLLAAWAAPGGGGMFAAGRGGMILSDVSGAWAALNQNLTDRDIKCVSGLSASSAWFAGASDRIIRYDGSTPFTLEREFTDEHLFCVTAAGPGSVFVGGSRGTVLKGGATGFVSTPTSVPSNIAGFHALSASDVYAVGNGGSILRYWDGGTGAPLAWTAVSSPTFASFNCVTSGAGAVWIAGDYNSASNEFTLLKDTGSGFAAVSPGLGYGENLNSIWADAAGNVFAAGDFGVIIRYEASSSTWHDDSLAFSLQSRIRAVAGVSGSDVLAAGHEGVLLHYNGTLWSRRDCPEPADFNSVWRADATNAWLVGERGCIWNLDTSTWTWTEISPVPATRNLRAVHGSAPNDVWAVGEGGICLHYDGTSWVVASSGAINGIFAVDASNVFAVGDCGLVLHGDGSGNWTPMAAPAAASVDLQAVFGFAPNQVWAVGKGGAAFLWDGLAWTANPAPSASDLWAVTGTGAAVWAAGDGGTLIRNQGTGWVDLSSDPALWPGTSDRITGLLALAPNDVYACTLNGGLHRYTNPAWPAPGSPSAGFIPAPAGVSRSVAALDLNSNSRLDLVFAGPGQDRVWINLGNGFLNDETASRIPADSSSGTCVAAGGLYRSANNWNLKLSLDSDAHADMIVSASEGRTRLLVNTGAGSFTDGTDPLGLGTTGLPAPADSTCVALGDVDGDGLPDAVVGRFSGRSVLLLNRGGRFVDSNLVPGTGLPANSDPVTGVVMLDVDGDGDLDIVFANLGAAPRLLLNDGNGLFSEPATALLPADVMQAACVAAADFNLDGRIDLVFGVLGGENRVYMNGPAGFQHQASALPAGHAHDTTCLAIADLNGDGLPDIVAGNSGARCRLYFNDMPTTAKFDDGTEGFSSGLPDLVADTRAVLAGDLDGDGDADLVLINRGSQNVLLINDGNGAFTDGTDLQQTAATGLPYDIEDGVCGVLADVDGDGDLDIVVGNHAGQARLYLNDGLAEFSDGTDEIQVARHGMPTGAPAVAGIAAADLDGDGDLDLFLACKGADLVLFNE